MEKKKVILTLRKPARELFDYGYIDKMDANTLVAVCTIFEKYAEQVEFLFSRESSLTIVGDFKDILRRRRCWLNKPACVRLLASFAQEIDNILSLGEALCINSEEMWRLIIENVNVDFHDIKRYLGRKPKGFNHYDWHGVTALMEPLFIYCGAILDFPRYASSKEALNDADGELFLPQESREKLAQKLLGEEMLHPKTIEHLPNERLIIENFEDSARRDLEFVRTLHTTGNLFTPTGTLTVARLRAHSKKIRSAEFKTHTDGDTLMRSELFISAAASYISSRIGVKDYEVEEEVARFAKYVALSFANSFSQVNYALFFQNIKGFIRGLIECSRASMLTQFLSSLISPAMQGWFDVANLEIRYLCSDHLITNKAAYTALFSADSYYRTSIHFSESFRRPDLWRDLTWPFAIKWMRMMCACGLMELACDPNADINDATEGIRYVRYTPLGLYAIGVTDKYELKDSESAQKQFEADAENKIITVLDVESPYLIFLSQIGRKISATRYYVSAETIVAACTSLQDVESKINILKKYICSGEADKWDKEFAEAKQRASSIIRIEEKYYLYELDSTVPGLIEFVTSDPMMGIYCLRAEKNHLLVRDIYCEGFSKRLREGGYLVANQKKQ